MSNKNQIHIKNKEYYTYFISNDIKEEIEKYSGDEKNEKILEYIPNNIIEKKTIKFKNIIKDKIFRKGKLHFTKNNNIVNLTYNGIIDTFNLDDLKNIDNNSYVDDVINIEDNIIGLNVKDETYNILQNISYNNNIIINNIKLYGKKENNTISYNFKNDNFYIYYNMNIKLKYLENNVEHFIELTDNLYKDSITDTYYVIFLLNDKKYIYYYDNEEEEGRKHKLKNINDEQDTIIINYVELTLENNNLFIGDIEFNDNQYVILNYYITGPSGGVPHYVLYRVDNENKTLNEIDGYNILLGEENKKIEFSFNEENNILNGLVEFNITNKTINNLKDWLNDNTINRKIVINEEYKIMNEKYNNSYNLYSNSYISPVGTKYTINDDKLYVYTNLSNIFKQNYYGRYFKQFSAVDPENNEIQITYKGEPSIEVIVEKKDDEEDNNEEDGINKEIENYYEEIEQKQNEEEQIKPKIDDITDDNYYEYITEIYRPKTIQKCYIPIQCIYTLTSITNTDRDSNNHIENLNININPEKFSIKNDIDNSISNFNIELDDIYTVYINSTDDILIKDYYIPLLILPNGELILKLDEFDLIDKKPYLDYGKTITTNNLTFDYPSIYMLRKLIIPSFSCIYNLTLETINNDNEEDLLNRDYDLNTKHYIKVNYNNLDFSYYSKDLN